MIGQATARLHHAPRRWLLGAWGEANIHSRQKWHAVWPLLAALPPRGLRVLDAGCAEGAWLLELASRRPGWSVSGIDRDADRIGEARSAAARLRLANAEASVADFLTYQPAAPFDAVLSVSSAHYLVEEGDGARLFRAFHDWLAPGGSLILYGPRARSEVPRLGLLPPPFHMRDVFTAGALRALCAGAGLSVERLSGVVGAAGTVAKQLSQAATGSTVRGVATYPAQVALSTLDRLGHSKSDRRSSGLLLLARRPAVEGTS